MEEHIANIQHEILDQYVNDKGSRPWIIAFSGGKDSTTMLQLVWKCLKNIEPHKRIRQIYIVCNNTLVENPTVLTYVKKQLELLNGLVPYPVLASKKKIEEAKVHEKFGCCICQITDSESLEIRELRRKGRYIELYYIGEHTLYTGANGTIINLTANWVNSPNPYIEISDTTYNIGISDHADFNETLEYVRETEAKIVLTDSTRGNEAHKLASSITKRLGIKAHAANPIFTRAWGV